jgi:hypothetical protein
MFDRSADVSSYKKFLPRTRALTSLIDLLLCGAVRPHVHCVSHSNTSTSPGGYDVGRLYHEIVFLTLRRGTVTIEESARGSCLSVPVV